MFELAKTDEVKELIAITKSDSGVSGPRLAYAHMKLGEILARHMPFDPDDTTVIAILRGGIFFAEGIYFQLGCKFDVYDPKQQEFVKPNTTNVIIVDSVINTGKTLMKILTPDMYVASCVVNEKTVEMFGKNLYTVRVSRNTFVGANIKEQRDGKGPDTTMRLFNQL